MRTMWVAAVVLGLSWSNSASRAEEPSGQQPPEQLRMPAAEGPIAAAANTCSTCGQPCKGAHLSKICHWLTFRPSITGPCKCGGCVGPIPQLYTFFLRPCHEGCGTPCAPAACAKSPGCSNCR
jgi:hypothetical protein